MARIMKGKFVSALIVCGMMTSPLLAQTAPIAKPTTGPIAVPNESYVLGAGDIIEITIVGGVEPPMRVEVQADGTIQMAMIGTVQAGGKTLLQLRDAIGQALIRGGFYARPAVNISIVTYASRYVVVLGQVNQPGTVPIDRPYRVSDVLARVGGVKDANVNLLKLRRAAGDELTLDVSAIATGGPKEDPMVAPGDKIFVPEAQTFYISGAVTRPGNYPVEAELTLRKALAIAGGLTQLGSSKKVKVIRNGKELKKYKLDDPIMMDDVIEIGERFF